MSQFIDIKFINLLSNKLEKFKRKSETLFNFRWPHCGDSKKSTSKARGFLYQKKNDMFKEDSHSLEELLLADIELLTNKLNEISKSLST